MAISSGYRFIVVVYGLLVNTSGAMPNICMDGCVPVDAAARGVPLPSHTIIILSSSSTTPGSSLLSKEILGRQRLIFFFPETRPFELRNGSGCQWDLFDAAGAAAVGVSAAG